MTTAIKQTVLSVATDFSTTPGPRKRIEGRFSGEEFREDILRPKFVSVVESGSRLIVNLDGTSGYSTSFLEEAFGGLARQFGSKKVLEFIEYVSNNEPYLIDDIKRYVAGAADKK